MNTLTSNCQLLKSRCICLECTGVCTTYVHKTCEQEICETKVWRYIKLKTHNILNVAQTRNAQCNKTCNVARNLNVLTVAKLIRCRKWKRFNAKNLIVSTNNCSALKNCSVPKMRNVSKRWNAPILCNVLRSCSVAQNGIVSNMAISSG